MANCDLFEKALVFAARAHQGQLRKGTDIPYIIHPVSTAVMLKDLNCSQTLIIAALLHDTVEDTEVTLTQVEAEFGSEIAALVEAVSEPNKRDPWEKRKAHTIKMLVSAPLPVKLIACADKLHNVNTLTQDYEQLGEAVWSRFGRGRDKQAWYYRGVTESLLHGVETPERYPIFAKLKCAVDNLFRE